MRGSMLQRETRIVNRDLPAQGNLAADYAAATAWSKRADDEFGFKPWVGPYHSAVAGRYFFNALGRKPMGFVFDCGGVMSC